MKMMILFFCLIAGMQMSGVNTIDQREGEQQNPNSGTSTLLDDPQITYGDEDCEVCTASLSEGRRRIRKTTLYLNFYHLTQQVLPFCQKCVFYHISTIEPFGNSCSRKAPDEVDYVDTTAFWKWKNVTMVCPCDLPTDPAKLSDVMKGVTNIIKCPATGPTIYLKSLYKSAQNILNDSTVLKGVNAPSCIKKVTDKTPTIPKTQKVNITVTWIDPKLITVVRVPDDFAEVECDEHDTCGDDSKLLLVKMYELNYDNIKATCTSNVPSLTTCQCIVSSKAFVMAVQKQVENLAACLLRLHRKRYFDDILYPLFACAQES